MSALDAYALGALTPVALFGVGVYVYGEWELRRQRPEPFAVPSPGPLNKERDER